MTIDERNEGYSLPVWNGRGGKLGHTPILWEIRMAYTWSEEFADSDPDWDQCMTCWLWAVSESEARAGAWKQDSMYVMPECIASIYPVRFMTGCDAIKEARWAA